MRTQRLWLQIILAGTLIFSFVLGFFVLENNPAQAQTIDNSMPTIAYNKAGEQVLAPDFTKLTFGMLSPIEEAGWIRVPNEFTQQLGYDPSREWGELANVADVVKLGDIEGLGVGNFSLSEIANITHLDLQKVPLSAFEIAGRQTVGDLVKAIPQLGELNVSQVQPIADLLGQVNGGDWNENIGSIATNEALSSLQLGKYLDLNKYSLDSIPGLTTTSLQSFKAWQQSSIAGVLGKSGLASVPFASYPTPILNGIVQVGKVDFVWGNAEHGDNKASSLYISGAVKSRSDQTTPVPCSAEKPCPYIELEDSISIPGSLHGKRWAVGSATGSKGMKVKEGYGPYALMNGGWGAAGVTVFGVDFGKLAVTKTNESTDKVEVSLFLRACGQYAFYKTCSPYFIGPIHFYDTKAKGLIVVASNAIPKIDIPAKYADQIAQIQRQNEPQSENTYVDNCVTGVTGDAVNKAISAAPEDMRRYASKTVPLVLAAAKKYGVTDPAQVAYMLSTVQTETTMGANVVEGATRNKSAPGSIYYGRGLTQLTGLDNYSKASKIVGVDLVKNPERAAEPEIAAKILVVGMRDGVFTGRKLSDFITNGKANFVGARQIVNDSDKEYEMAQNANRYLQAINGTDIANLKETGSNCASSINNGKPGEANANILKAINKLGSFSSNVPGTGGGVNACMWAVNNVLKNAGYAPLANDTLAVRTGQAALEGGRGQKINITDAQAGDIVLVDKGGSEQHIGFCLNQGCTQTISNSSSKASFSFHGNSNFSYPGSPYNGATPQVYRLLK